MRRFKKHPTQLMTNRLTQMTISIGHILITFIKGPATKAAREIHGRKNICVANPITLFQYAPTIISWQRTSINRSRPKAHMEKACKMKFCVGLDNLNEQYPHTSKSNKPSNMLTNPVIGRIVISQFNRNPRINGIIPTPISFIVLSIYTPP